MFGPFKKERPIQGLTGMGGGAASTLVGGGVAPGITATGGNVTTTYTMPDGTMYKAHIFTASGSLAVTDIGGQGAECEFVVVGGGGGASNQHSGGGGAGGYRSSVVGELSGGPASSLTNVNNNITWSDHVSITAGSPTGFDKPAANMFTGTLDNSTRLMTTANAGTVTLDMSPTGAGPVTIGAGGQVVLYAERSSPNPAAEYLSTASVTVDGVTTPSPAKVVHTWTFPTGGTLTSMSCVNDSIHGRTYIEGMAVNGYMLVDGQPNTSNGIGGGAEDVQVLSVATYPVTIGSGGAGSTPGPNGGSPRGSYGGYSEFSGTTPIRAIGGGGSGNWSSSQSLRKGNPGGSGGGTSSHTGPGDGGSAAGTVGQGYGGGTGSPGPLAHIGGGGGGAGELGESCTGTDSSDCFGGGGGTGRGTLIMGPTYTTYGTPGPGPGRYFAGGGGSAYYNPTNPTGIGVGGAGGGASGLQGPTPADGTAGTTNTGGGGGGSIDFTNHGGAGGPGIVILRYKINASQL